VLYDAGMVTNPQAGSFNPHQPPYDVDAHPYNYSDMTGFNERVVNPTFQPFKGYWIVISDGGVTNEFWQRVTWDATLTNGCSVEAFVRAADARTNLSLGTFVAVSNNAPLTGVNGRFVELRLALTRDDPSKQPTVSDVTLYGIVPSFNSDAWLDDASADETQNATFSPYVAGPGPLTYQWYVQYPWMNDWDWTLVPGATNSEFIMTNVDSWVGGYLDSDDTFHWTRTSVFVTDATGESLWLGPASLYVWPLPIGIPSLGSASRYPAIIDVFGQPTNLSKLKVTLFNLTHGRSSDLNILLVSPSGTNIMLMSHAGGTNALSEANLVFKADGSAPPSSDRIPSGQTSYYEPSNYGPYGQSTPLPGAPAGRYSTDFGDLAGGDPNGFWRLYIYDDRSGMTGQVSGSSAQGTWQLHLEFQ
jgi:subtilisin-like proprotein convertase family protein